MKELKTLKDFWGIYPEVNSNKHIDVEELKAEAVKWIKNLNRYGCKKEILNGKFKGYECGFSYEGMIPLCSNCESKINWIIEFFNLTEEDLK